MDIDNYGVQVQDFITETTGVEGLDTITEKELADNARNGAITGLRAFKTQLGENEGWSVLVNLGWKEGDLLLITTRKTPKSWLSHDRLLAHLQSLELKITKTETVSLFSNNVLLRAETSFSFKKGTTYESPKPKSKPKAAKRVVRKTA